MQVTREITMKSTQKTITHHFNEEEEKLAMSKVSVSQVCHCTS